MSPLRVVHAVRSDGFAGVERHIVRLAVAQVALGHEVEVIGGDAVRMRAGLGMIPQRPASTVLDTARAIDAWRRCDLLHVHMTAAETAAVLAVRSWRVPVVTTRHFAGRRGASWSGRLAAPFIARRIAAQISISRYVADHVEGASTVVHPGVAEQPDAASAARRERTVLVAQRLEAEKSTEVAVRAFARSGVSDRGWRLDIAGDGSQREGLLRLATESGVGDAVRFLGRRDDIAALMRRAGLLIAPCAVEGLGLTVLEAMAAGLPVVAARAGGHLETVGAVAGAALFAPGDAADAAALVQRLVDDTEARDRYGAALQSVQRERFTCAAQAVATNEVYRRVLG